MKYDFLIVGSGFYGAVCANALTARGKRCLVIEKRNHVGGNAYTETLAGITVHKYGAHIFHTDNERVWRFVSGFAEFNRFINSPIARYKNECYNLPFNMNTFTKLWRDVFTPAEAKRRIDAERAAYYSAEPKNLEQQAINLVGKTVYEKLVKGYTEKQWGKSCSELPAFIIKRLPVRFTFDNNYFNDRYQGIPVGGYTQIIEKLLEGSEVRLECDYLQNRDYYSTLADGIIYTGPIDAYYDFKFGALEYRSLRFETQILDEANYQGNAVVNYTDAETPYTRVIEHKHFEFGTQEKTVVTREFPAEWKIGAEPFYPLNDAVNDALYLKYRELSSGERNVFFGGRLGRFKYCDMDDAVLSALEFTDEICV